jgi:MFS family permease
MAESGGPKTVLWKPMRIRRRLLSLLHTRERLTERDLERATGLITADGICSMAMASLQGGPFLTAFALGIGASNYEIGLLAAIGFLSQTVQLPALFLLRIFPYRRAITVASALTSRLAWVFIILTPALFVDRGISWVVHWLFLSAVLTSAAAPAWNSLLHDLVPGTRLGHVFSLRTVLGNLVALPLTIGGGFFVDWWRERLPEAGLYAYALLFLVGLGFGLAGIVAIARLPEPTMTAPAGVRLTQLLSQPLRDANYRGFLVFIGAWTFAVNLATPFFAAYMLRRLGLTLSTVTALTVVAQVANLAFLRIWGRLADRFSNKAVITACAPFYLLAFAAWAFTGPHWLTLPLLVLIHVVSGMATAGIGLPIGNIGLKLAPSGSAHAYITLAGLTGAVSGALAPLVAGVLADFFAARRLGLLFTWSEPSREYQFHALRIEALDFVFLLAILVGGYALSRLARVEEAGQITERSVMDEAFDQVVLPFRTMSTVEGIRRVTFFPLWALQRLRPGRERPPGPGTAPGD